MVSHHVPRWALNHWLPFLSRLATKDRLITWGVRVDPKRALCQVYGKSHYHLLLNISESLGEGTTRLAGITGWARAPRGGNSTSQIVFTLPSPLLPIL